MAIVIGRTIRQPLQIHGIGLLAKFVVTRVLTEMHRIDTIAAEMTMRTRKILRKNSPPSARKTPPVGKRSAEFSRARHEFRFDSKKDILRPEAAQCRSPRSSLEEPQYLESISAPRRVPSSTPGAESKFTVNASRWPACE